MLSLSMVFKQDFIRCVDFIRTQLQTQQLMTSQIRSFIKHVTAIVQGGPKNGYTVLFGV